MSLTPRVVLLLAGLAAATPAPASASERPPDAPARRIAVPDVKAIGTFDPKAVAGLSSYIASETSRQGLRVISGSDIAALLGFEKQRELLSCNDSSCMVEMGGALGVDHLLSSEISEVGGVWLLSITLLDLTKGRGVARLTKRAEQQRGLVDLVPGAVEEVLGAANLVAKPPQQSPAPAQQFPAPPPAAQAPSQTPALAPSALAPPPPPSATPQQAAAGPTVSGTGAGAPMAATEEQPHDASVTARSSGSLRTVGLVLAGAGLAIGGAGAGLHAASLDSWNHYLQLKNQGNAPAAAAAKANSDDRMLAAEVLYGVGGAALVAGVIVAIVGWPQDGPAVAFSPLASGGAAIVATGSFQ